MIRLMILLAVSMCLAYCSQHDILVVPVTKKFKIDIPLILIILLLSCFAGLRTQYNDTATYATTFKIAPTVSQYLNSSPEFFSNPLFYLMQSFFRHHIMNNYHLFFFAIALFTISCMLWFIRKYSCNFTFSIFIFFCLGSILIPISAMKQGIAIAIILIGIDQLLKKRVILFYVCLTFAILFHSYAILFIILPLFLGRPWTIFTYIAVGAVVLILFSFESAITNLLSVTQEAGKSLTKEELFESQGINLFRLSVYAAPPLLSFIFQEILNPSYTKYRQLFANMSILSFLIMSMGIFSAANLFGRSAIYFEIGTILILSWIIEEIFDKESRTTAYVFVGGCYLAFFAYMVKDFSHAYRAIDVIEFIQTLI